MFATRSLDGIRAGPSVLIVPRQIAPAPSLPPPLPLPLLYGREPS